MGARSSRWLVAVAGVSLLGALAWLAFAPLSENPPGPAEYREGEVISVDPADSRLMLRAGLGWRARDLLVRVRPGETRILYRGAPVELGEVRRGDHATVRFVVPESPSGNEVPAREIWIARAEGPLTR